MYKNALSNIYEITRDELKPETIRNAVETTRSIQLLDKFSIGGNFRGMYLKSQITIAKSQYFKIQ